MAEKFKVGEKVIIRLAGEDTVSVRDTALGSFNGQTGEVVGFHSISPAPGQVFYIYTVTVGPDGRKVVLHEDEIETRLAPVSLGGRGRR